uniref:AMP-dependent synthetase/ligase domain-containing protein n=1 Tax=Meloidogyne incognita TaxID=6306 RepID=A0A914M428_MELIC
MPYKSDFPPVEIANEPYPPRLLSALWEHFSECPERIALINSKEPNTDFVTFGELYVFSLATAAFLQNRGFLFGDVACLVMQNCWEYVPIFAGIGLQGGATSGANPYFTQRELQYQFNESQAKIVFCSETCLDNVIGAVKGAQTVKTIVLVESGHSKKPLNQNENQLPFGVIRFGQVLRTEPTIAIEFSLINCRPDKDIILLPFSSGTTGSPKGVIITHKNIGTMLNILIDHFRNQIHAYMRPTFIEKEENELLLLPFFHCYGFCMLQACLLNGSTGLVMAGFEPKLFCETIQNFRKYGGWRIYNFKKRKVEAGESGIKLKKRKVEAEDPKKTEFCGRRCYIRLIKTVPPILVFLAKNQIVSNYDLSSVNVIFSGAAPAGADLCEEVLSRLPNVQHICQGIFFMIKLE